MTEILAFGAGVMVTITLVQLYMLGPRANALQREIDELKAKLKKEEHEGAPYWLRNAAEDVMVPNVRILLEIQTFLTVLENELAIQRQLVGQIRDGTWTKDQPAAKRNGRVREPFAERSG